MFVERLNAAVDTDPRSRGAQRSSRRQSISGTGGGVRFEGLLIKPAFCSVFGLSPVPNPFPCRLQSRNSVRKSQEMITGHGRVS